MAFIVRQGFSQDVAASMGLSAPFFAIAGLSVMVENRVPFTYGSSIAVNANWLPLARSLGAGVVVDAQIRFYTTRKRNAPVEVPLFGFFIGPSVSFGAVGFGRIYEGNGRLAVIGAVMGNRFKVGYSGLFIEPSLSAQYGLYRRSGDFSRNYYHVVPWLSAGVGIGFTK